MYDETESPNQGVLRYDNSESPRGASVYKIYNEPELPHEGGVFKIYDEPESPHEVMQNRTLQIGIPPGA